VTLRKKLKEDFVAQCNAELKCSVCDELFIEPMSLSCGHVFCQFCINQWKKTCTAAGKQVGHQLQPVLTCPNCRQAITITPTKSIQIQNIIESLYRSNEASPEVKAERSLVIDERKGAEKKEAAKVETAAAAAALAAAPTGATTRQAQGRRTARAATARNAAQATNRLPNTAYQSVNSPSNTGQAANRHPNSTQAANRLPNTTQAANRLPNTTQAANRRPNATQAANRLPNATQAANRLPNATQATNRGPNTVSTPAAQQLPRLSGSVGSFGGIQGHQQLHIPANAALRAVNPAPNVNASIYRVVVPLNGQPVSEFVQGAVTAAGQRLRVIAPPIRSALTTIVSSATTASISHSPAPTSHVQRINILRPSPPAQTAAAVSAVTPRLATAANGRPPAPNGAQSHVTGGADNRQQPAAATGDVINID